MAAKKSIATKTRKRLCKNIIESRAEFEKSRVRTLIMLDLIIDMVNLHSYALFRDRFMIYHPGVRGDGEG